MDNPRLVNIPIPSLLPYNPINFILLLVFLKPTVHRNNYNKHFLISNSMSVTVVTSFHKLVGLVFVETPSP